jgi:hypothetical protein
MQYFFECYFNQGEDFDDLDKVIQDYKDTEKPESLHNLITELHQIIQTKNYELASRIMKKYGNRILSLEKTEKFINFLYDRFISKSTSIVATDFEKKLKGVFCPVCCPNPKTAKNFSLIEKAMIIGKNMQIYICKACKHVWFTDDIRIDNAQDYKKFMKSIGLKGLWKELSDVDIL